MNSIEDIKVWFKNIVKLILIFILTVTGLFFYVESKAETKLNGQILKVGLFCVDYDQFSTLVTESEDLNFIYSKTIIVIEETTFNQIQLNMVGVKNKSSNIVDNWIVNNSIACFLYSEKIQEV